MGDGFGDEAFVDRDSGLDTTAADEGWREWDDFDGMVEAWAEEGGDMVDQQFRRWTWS